MKQGTRANHNGQEKENQVEYLLRTYDFKQSKVEEYVKSKGQVLLEPRAPLIYVKSAPYINIYGGGKNHYQQECCHDMEWQIRNVKKTYWCKSEFLLDINGKTIRVEQKNQEGSGSAAEKLPYFFRHIEQGKFKEDEFILCLTGAYWGQGHFDEVKVMIEEIKEKVGKKVHLAIQIEGLEDLIRGFIDV